jgi:branched-subunit amino acid ABC-type transport system permease component
MGIALQLLFTGLDAGSIYALVALGFVLIYRASNAVNFAQGDFAMLGAFSMVVLCGCSASDLFSSPASACVFSKND